MKNNTSVRRAKREGENNTSSLLREGNKRQGGVNENYEYEGLEKRGMLHVELLEYGEEETERVNEIDRNEGTVKRGGI